jgi:HlyD family secretion protein
MKQASAVLKGASTKYELVKKGARKEDISQMQEVVKQAKIGVDKLAKDLERAQDLLNSKSIPQKQFDDLKAAHDLASAQLAAVSQQYKKILNGALPEEIEAVQAMVEQAESTIEIIKKKMSYCALLSPVSGTVIQKLSLKGELAPPGMPVGIIADLTHVKVKGFVAEDELGFIKIGNTAKIFIDSQPDSPVEGKISFISSEAEFTPKNIQTQKERVKTMYEIQASVDNSEGKLKDGMPADIVIKK